MYIYVCIYGFIYVYIRPYIINPYIYTGLYKADRRGAAPTPPLMNYIVH